MNAELHGKLTEDLKKSGYHAEMLAIQACIAAKWQCHGSFTYFDRDARTTRECDFTAVREWLESSDHGAGFQVVARLVGQVKKSESPWIGWLTVQRRGVA